SKSVRGLSTRKHGRACLIGVRLLLNAEEFCGWLERNSVNALLRQLRGIKTNAADLVAQTPHGHAVALGSVPGRRARFSCRLAYWSGLRGVQNYTKLVSTSPTATRQNLADLVPFNFKGGSLDSLAPFTGAGLRALLCE